MKCSSSLVSLVVGTTPPKLLDTKARALEERLFMDVNHTKKSNQLINPLPVNQSIDQSMIQSINQSSKQAIKQSINQQTNNKSSNKPSNRPIMSTSSQWVRLDKSFSQVITSVNKPRWSTRTDLLTKLPKLLSNSVLTFTAKSDQLNAVS